MSRYIARDCDPALQAFGAKERDAETSTVVEAKQAGQPNNRSRVRQLAFPSFCVCFHTLTACLQKDALAVVFG